MILNKMIESVQDQWHRGIERSTVDCYCSDPGSIPTLACWEIRKAKPPGDGRFWNGCLLTNHSTKTFHHQLNIRKDTFTLQAFSL